MLLASPFHVVVVIFAAAVAAAVAAVVVVVAVYLDLNVNIAVAVAVAAHDGGVVVVGVVAAVVAAAVFVGVVVVVWLGKILGYDHCHLIILVQSKRLICCPRKLYLFVGSKVPFHSLYPKVL